MIRLVMLGVCVLALGAGRAPVVPAAPVPGITVGDDADALVLTFPHGQQLHWAKAGCTLDRWLDAQGHVLGRFLEFQPNTTGQNDTRVYTGYTLHDERVTVHCTVDLGGTVTPLHLTFAGVSRPWGDLAWDGVSWQITVDGPLQALGTGIYGLQYDGDPYGWRALRIQANRSGIAQMNYLTADDAEPLSTDATFSFLQRPEGAVVAYVPDLYHAGPNLHGPATRPDPPWGVGLVQDWRPATTGQPTFATPTVVYLWSAAAGARPLPQNWADVRFGTAAEQWASLGLGVQHLHVPAARAATGITARAAAAAGPAYLADPDNFLTNAVAQRVQHIFHDQQNLGLFVSERPNDPDHITHAASLNAPELPLPSLDDLDLDFPGLRLPGQGPLLPPTGAGYTTGTAAEFRAMLNADRALGLFPSAWTRQYMAGCVGVFTQYSRFDKTWPCSILWQLAPQWGNRFADGTLDPAPQAYPNLTDPDYRAWRIAYHRYWAQFGMLQLFRDTDTFPNTGLAYNAAGQGTTGDQAEWDLLRDFLQHGGAQIAGEIPLWLTYGQDPGGNPKLSQYTEWAWPMMSTGWGSLVRGDSVVYWDADMAWNPATARRFTSMYSGQPCCDFDTLMNSPAGVNTTAAQFTAENAYAGQFNRRWGPPDRIELVSPQPVAVATTLWAPLAATGTVMHLANIFRLPLSGVVQIDAEQLHYRTTCDANGQRALGGESGDCFQTLVRGYAGTTAADHAAGATVTSLDDVLHWDWTDTLWVYGSGASATKVRYSDGAIVQGTVPVLNDVTIDGSTLSWTTDVPTQAWVEYDTFGDQEAATARRQASAWPYYQWHSNLTDAPLSRTTSHRVTLPNLQDGALYHYRIVARGPAPVTTDDATFQVDTRPRPATPTATPLPATATPTATAPPTLTATVRPTDTPSGTATPTPGAVSCLVPVVRDGVPTWLPWPNCT